MQFHTYENIKKFTDFFYNEVLSVGLRINDSSSLIVTVFLKKLEYFSGKKVESVCFLLNGFVKKEVVVSF